MLKPVRLDILGRIGRGTKPPPQFGHTFSSISFTHVTQKVHSYVQIIASVESGTKSLLQHSQLGLISNIYQLRFDSFSAWLFGLRAQIVLQPMATTCYILVPTN